MKGVFKEMLEDYLKIVAKDEAKAGAKDTFKVVAKDTAKDAAKTTAKDAAKTGAKDAAKTGAKDAAKSAAKKEGAKVAEDGAVDLGFKLTKKVKGFPDELQRQLDRQLRNMDGLTPDELLHGKGDEFAGLLNKDVRKGVEQAEARKVMTSQMKESALSKIEKMTDDEFATALKEAKIPQTANPMADMKSLASHYADGFMDNVAALHEPDIVAGGRDIIGRVGGDLRNLGLSNVNSSIGSQWRNIAPDLVDLLKKLPPDQPVHFRYSF